MKKFRLILKGEIVGYERHVLVSGFIEIQHSKDQKEWNDITINHITQRSPVVVEESYYIDHDDKESYIGVTDSKGVEVYENDNLSLQILNEIPEIMRVALKYGCFGYYAVEPEKVNPDDRAWRPFYHSEDHEMINMDYFTVIDNCEGG